MCELERKLPKILVVVFKYSNTQFILCWTINPSLFPVSFSKSDVFVFDNDKNAKLMKVFPILASFLKNKMWQKQPREVAWKKGDLKNFANFKKKHLCWSLFIITLQTLKPVTLLNKDSNTDVFL